MVWSRVPHLSGMVENDSHKSRKTVVTGASGMVGSHLVCHLLKNGYEHVTAVVRSEKSLVKLKKTMIKEGVAALESLLDIKVIPFVYFEPMKEVLSGCDLFFNCAADLSFDGGADSITLNRDLAFASAQAALECNVPLTVHVSSIATLSANDVPKLTNEENYMETLSTSSSYGAGKFWAESEFWRIKEAGANVVVINPSVILCDDEWHNSALPYYVKMVRKGVPSVKNGTTGYVSVHDTVTAMELLSRIPSAVGERFIVSADNLSLDEMWKIVSKAIGRTNAPAIMPDFMLDTLYNILKIVEKTGLNFILKSSHVEPMRHRRIYDGSKLVKYCPEFKYTPIEDAVIGMLNYISKA